MKPAWKVDWMIFTAKFILERIEALHLAQQSDPYHITGDSSTVKAASNVALLLSWRNFYSQ
jgi:hypothetical protein